MEKRCIIINNKLDLGGVNMTYSSIVKEAKKAMKAIDAKKITEHVAVEIDIVGEGEGAFYIELDPSGIKVEPYEYYDRDFLIKGEAAIILDVLKGNKTVDQVKDVVFWEGNMAKAPALKKALEPGKIESKKTDQKKIENKKAPAKKLTSKKEEPKKLAAKESPKKIATKKK